MKRWLSKYMSMQFFFSIGLKIFYRHLSGIWFYQTLNEYN